MRVGDGHDGRHKTIPKRPARLDGELVVLVDSGDIVTAEQEAGLTAELAKHGAVERAREPGRLRVRLASHAAAEAAAAAGVAGAVAVFPFWNARSTRWGLSPSLTTPYPSFTFLLAPNSLLGSWLDVLRKRRERRGD